MVVSTITRTDVIDSTVLEQEAFEKQITVVSTWGILLENNNLHKAKGLNMLIHPGTKDNDHLHLITECIFCVN